MKRKILILVISSIMISLAFMPGLDADVISFNKQLTINSYREFSGASSVKQTSDGGFIAIGYTGGEISDGEWEYDTWAIKLDSNGNEEWNKIIYPGSGSGHSIYETEDGGYIFCGTTEENDKGYTSPKVIKIDAEGNIQWDKEWDKYWWYYSAAMEETNDGGYIITGMWNTGILLMKINSEGNKIWEQVYYGDDVHGGDYSGESVQQTSDGGYIVTGYLYTGAEYGHVFLIKTDNLGNIEWWKDFGKDIGMDENALSVKETNDGGFIITGAWYSPNGGIYLLKTDSQGNEIWKKTYPETRRGNVVLEIEDGGFIVAGNSEGETGYYIDGYLLHTDSMGIKKWEKIHGESINCIDQTNDGGYILGCSHTHKLLLIKTDEDGGKIWEKVYGNRRPERPIIEAPPTGKAERRTWIKISTTDPDGDQVFYYVDWGDGWPEPEWIGPYDSGKTVSLSHIYIEESTWSEDYWINVNCKDINNEESYCSSYHKIQIDKSRSINNPFTYQLKQFFEKWDFPLLTRLIHLL